MLSLHKQGRQISLSSSLFLQRGLPWLVLLRRESHVVRLLMTATLVGFRG